MRALLICIYVIHSRENNLRRWSFALPVGEPSILSGWTAIKPHIYYRCKSPDINLFGGIQFTRWMSAVLHKLLHVCVMICVLLDLPLDQASTAHVDSTSIQSFSHAFQLQVCPTEKEHQQNSAFAGMVHSPAGSEICTPYETSCCCQHNAADRPSVHLPTQNVFLSVLVKIGCSIQRSTTILPMILIRIVLPVGAHLSCVHCRGIYRTSQWIRSPTGMRRSARYSSFVCHQLAICN